MDRDSNMIYAALFACVVIPAAIAVGAVLTSPFTMSAMLTVGLFLALFAVPFLLAHYHLLLIVCWNSTLIVFVLPGQPHLATVLACVGFLFIFGNTLLHRMPTPLRPVKLTLPLLLLVAVVAISAVANGGVGGRVLGTEKWGLRNYVFIFGALICFYVITAKSVPRKHAWLAAFLFVGGAMTALVSDLVFAAGPKFYFLYALFHTEYAMHQATSEDAIVRLAGVGNAGMAATSLFFLKFGVSGLLEWRKPWRLFGILLCLGISLLGGFRSTVALFLLTFAVLFFLEGLHKTILMPIVAVGFAVALVFIVSFSESLPLNVQRCFSFLPIRLHPQVEFDARQSLDWRLGMWKRAVSELPHYFWFGKGFSFSASDYNLASEAVRRGFAESYEAFFISGDFHNGVLTTLLPLGIFGLLAFVWFGCTALWILVQNFRWGDPYLLAINRFILAAFLVRFFYFFTFYGSFVRDLAIFCGFVGLSLSLNGGVHAPPPGQRPLPLRPPGPVPA